MRLRSHGALLATKRGNSCEGREGNASPVSFELFQSKFLEATARARTRANGAFLEGGILKPLFAE